MSRSPDRTSSYRRHFDPSISSPSPVRRETRHRPASFTRSATVGRRIYTSNPRMSSVSLEDLCFGPALDLVPNLDMDEAAAENQAFLVIRTKERQEMIALNNRLAVYIEKVRTLESENRLLEREIEAQRNRRRPSGLRRLYESQLRDLTREAEQMTVQRDLSLAAKKAARDQLDKVKAKYGDALEVRKKAELHIENLRPDVDKETCTRIAQERQMENLVEEQAFAQRVHEEEIEELMQQIYSEVSQVELTSGLPDLSLALKEIRSQYDATTAQNLQVMDDWYRSKIHNLSNASSKHVQDVRRAREEITAYKKDILNKERELEALKTTNEYLEAQISDAVEKYKKDEKKLEEHVEAIKIDLQVTKEKIALLLRDHQDLLNVKMALEMEIITSRKLIEGEDDRLGAAVETPPSVSCPGVEADRTARKQATEKSERKTLLTRTVQTDQDFYESNTQACTIIISGAADDTDEE